MLKKIIQSNAVALLFLAALFLPALTSAQTGPVVDVAWAAEHQDEVTFIHVSRRSSNYDDTGFIPGASFVSMSEYLTERSGQSGAIRYLAPSSEQFESLMQSHGVDNEDMLVLVPAGNAIYNDATAASRLYWQLKYFGHDAVAILNGGVAAWSDAGGDVTDVPAAASGGGGYEVAEIRDALLATTREVESVIAGDQDAHLVDNRPLVHFSGLAGRDYVAGRGHLAGAKPLPFNLFVKSSDGIVYWRNADEVQRYVSAMLPGVEGRVIDYCNSGHVSSLAWFAMSEIGGLEDVALYDGSLHEWTLDGGRPLVIGR